VKYLLENFNDIDVLIQNKFGRSILTEAFQSKNVDTIELVLSHPSASEEKLIPSAAPSQSPNGPVNHPNPNISESTMNTNTNGLKDTAPAAAQDKIETDTSDEEWDDLDKNAVYHFMSFSVIRTTASTSPDTNTTSTTNTVSNTTNTVSDNKESNLLRIRELPITRADNPFGTESAPEDDTTGE
jgi:hypothetical protein